MTAMLLAVLPCLVTTDIPAFQQDARLQHACAPGIAAIAIEGDHEHLVYTVRLSGELPVNPDPHEQARRVAQIFRIVTEKRPCFGSPEELACIEGLGYSVELLTFVLMDPVGIVIWQGDARKSDHRREHRETT